ncbi:hypothetical protein EBO15_33555 [Actinomadura harenae]|uniref:Uncharacterized protein n=1 Tax=Actinomadura harenae TaxID=2483351 RepID=A0A3M2LLA9_9ACTN|nr:hypothetical protein EBO15_33555 [Actinomadura harenae]
MARGRASAAGGAFSEVACDWFSWRGRLYQNSVSLAFAGAAATAGDVSASAVAIAAVAAKNCRIIRTPLLQPVRLDGLVVKIDDRIKITDPGADSKRRQR